MWQKPEVATYGEDELVEKLAVRAQTHRDSHIDGHANTGPND